MTQPEPIARIIARIFLGALDAAATAANGDPDAQRFCEQARDYLKPELDWMMRYGDYFEWPSVGEPEDDLP